jgi:alkanesulfonate monooxygenase SsuD/methylene tetrahydromethanopterin reductase-like flavin-dependent oxidoreductase (luciferase family)
MLFGLFGSAQAKRGGPDVDSGQGFREYVEFAVEADALGYHSLFVVEHHFTGFGQISASLNLLTWVAAKTRNLRVGTAVMVLPWHNPVLLAEQAAALDLLSEGRLDFGVGKGYRWNEFASFRIPMEEAEDRYQESLGLIIKSWTSDQRFSHRGKYWQFDDIIVEPPTKQKPHPPIWMGAGSPASIEKVAKLGFNVMFDQYAPTVVIGERVAIFKKACEAAGRPFDPMEVAVSRAVYIAKDEADKQRALEQRTVARARMNALAERPDGKNTSSLMAFADKKDASDESAVFGSPDEVAAKLERLRKLGVEHLLINFPGHARDSLRRFARDIKPAFAGTATVRAAE